jgi:hypothetical protein
MPNSNSNSPTTSRLVRVTRDLSPAWVGDLLDLEFMFAEDGDSFWLKFDSQNEACQIAAQRVPGEHFYVHGSSWLVRLGETIASRAVPTLNWISINNAIELRLPAAIYAGRLQAVAPVTWRLERSSNERPAGAALFTAQDLAQWASLVPAVRLKPLRFCFVSPASPSSEPTPLERSFFFVVGTPLPSIPCQFFCRYERVFIPAGFEWVPKLDITLVQKSFGLTGNQWLIWLESSEWTIIGDEMLVPMTRADVRTSLELVKSR